MNRYLSIALMLAVLPQVSIAGGKSSPFADSSIGVIINKDGTTTDCSKKPSKENARTELIKRRFTQLSIDPCVWSASVNLKDLTAPAKLYRIGADVSCTVEEATIPEPTTIPNDQFARFLEGRGFSEVAIESSTNTEIDEKPFKEQVLRVRMPADFDKSKPRYRAFFWLWAGSTRMTTLQCFGPADTALQEKGQIMAVSKTIRIED